VNAESKGEVGGPDDHFYSTEDLALSAVNMNSQCAVKKNLLMSVAPEGWKRKGGGFCFHIYFYVRGRQQKKASCRLRPFSQRQAPNFAGCVVDMFSPRLDYDYRMHMAM
jgi:hypothetical protein